MEAYINKKTAYSGLPQLNAVGCSGNSYQTGQSNIFDIYGATILGPSC